MNWFPVLICWCVRLISNSVHLPDGQTGVKSVFMHEAWLRSDEVQTSCGSDAMKCVRTRSRFRESTSTGTDLAGEDFQNTGTFIVVRSTVFVVSSAHKAHLARDAYNALWDCRPRSQGQYCSPEAENLSLPHQTVSQNLIRAPGGGTRGNRWLVCWQSRQLLFQESF